MKPAQLISRILIAVLTPLLAVLGFTGCGDDDDDDVAEYGAPYVELHVDGTVTDADGEPIQGIVFHVEGLLLGQRRHERCRREVVFLRRLVLTDDGHHLQPGGRRQGGR